MAEKKRSQLRVLLALHLLLMLFSTSGIFSKVAASYPFMSLGFILALGIYAVGWQQIIKRLPLTTAYSNRAVTVVWGIVWGIVLFHESVSPLKIVGAVVVLTGVALFAVADHEQDGQTAAGEGDEQ